MPEQLCAGCERSVFVVGVLYRTNPKGEIGIFKCTDCGGQAEDEVVKEIVEAVLDA